MTEIARIAIVTGGGDCPGMNAVIRAVAKAARLRGWETIGVTGGFDGLFDPQACHVLDYQDLYGLLTKGGSILGSANSGRFAAKVGGGEVRQLAEGLMASTKEAVERLGLSGLVVIGGDGTMSIALQLDAYGIPVVGVPKTIDNDLGATLQTFGFDSAVAYATDAVDRLQTTAESHRRAIVLEVMGRHAGWIALHAGISGGANAILIPEEPFDFDEVIRWVETRFESHYSPIIVVAEGALPKDGDLITKDQTLDAFGHVKLSGIGDWLASGIEARTGKEARTSVLGHIQRGGTPTAFDRVLATRFGLQAIDAVADKQFGVMVALRGTDIVRVPLLEATGVLKTVPPERYEEVRTFFG
jgi:6-phosphofructokinase 1